MTLPEKAKLFATAAHAGQMRKYTGDPYITHAAAVVAIVRTVPHTDAMLAAAWLHDVVEDTPVTLDAIRREFGDHVAELVDWLTSVSCSDDGNRAARKAIDRAKLAKAPPQAQTLKLADIIDNTTTIAARDPDFAPMYLAEKALLLDVLTRGDPALMKIAACRLVDEVSINATGK